LVLRGPVEGLGRLSCAPRVRLGYDGGCSFLDGGEGIDGLDLVSPRSDLLGHGSLRLGGDELRGLEEGRSGDVGFGSAVGEDDGRVGGGRRCG
jgi:hypothetical protein